jgi:hypothetical protein
VSAASSGETVEAAKLLDNAFWTPFGGMEKELE